MPIAGISQGLGIGGGTSATISGAPAGGFSEVYSCKFDDSDDELAVDGTLTALGAATSFTISLWADSDQASGAGHWTLFSCGTPVYKADRIWWVWGNNKSYFTAGGPAGTQKSASVTLSHPSSTFHHMVAVRDGDYVTLYVDGGTAAGGSQCAPVDFSAVSMPQSAYADDVLIGRYNAGQYTFNGNIDEVAVWDSALSAGTIADIYNSGVPTDLSSLSPVAWWRMGDSAGDTEDGGGAVTDGGTVGTVKNAADPGVNDATGNNGTIYEAYVPS